MATTNSQLISQILQEVDQPFREAWQITLNQLTPDELDRVQITTGAATARVAQIMHWPPDYSYHTHRRFNFRAMSTRMLIGIFEGLRKSDQEIYDGRLDIFQELMKRVVSTSAAELLFVWGRPARDAIITELKKQGNDTSEADGCKPAILFNVKYGTSLGGKTFVFLPHPECLQRYANPVTLDQVLDVLQHIELTFDIDIDITRIHARLLNAFEKQEQLAKELNIPVEEVFPDNEGDTTVIPLNVKDFKALLFNLGPVILSKEFMTSMRNMADRHLARRLIYQERGNIRRRMYIHAWRNGDNLPADQHFALQQRILEHVCAWQKLPAVPVSSPIHAEWAKHMAHIHKYNEQASGKVPFDGETQEQADRRKYEQNKAIRIRKSGEIKAELTTEQAAQRTKENRERYGQLAYEGETEQSRQARYDAWREGRREYVRNNKLNGLIRKAGETEAEYNVRQVESDLRKLQSQQGITARAKAARRSPHIDELMKQGGLTVDEADWYLDEIRNGRCTRGRYFRRIDTYSAWRSLPELAGIKPADWRLSRTAALETAIMATAKGKAALASFVRDLMSGRQKPPSVSNQPTKAEKLAKSQKDNKLSSPKMAKVSSRKRKAAAYLDEVGNEEDADVAQDREDAEVERDEQAGDDDKQQAEPEDDEDEDYDDDD